jgi:hypothetical protein
VNIEYMQVLKTKPVVEYLIGCRDQVASTDDIAEEFLVATSTARTALERLRKVGRVDEIHPNLWHLE